MSKQHHVKYILLIGSVLFFLVSVPFISLAKTSVFTIGTGDSMGNYHVTGLAIADIVNKRQKDHGFRLETKSTLGSVFNVNAIIAGDIQFGLVQADRQYQAVKGLSEWKGKGPQRDLRSVLSTYTESVTIVASGESGIKTIQDLKGKRVDIGHPDSGGHQNAIDALYAAGIDWKKDIIVYGEETFDGPRMLFDGKLDAFFHTVGHPSEAIKWAMVAIPGARFIPLVNIDRLLSKHPYYSKSFIPIKLYLGAGNRKDVETFGVKATLVTSSNIPSDVVYAITKSIFDDFEALRKSKPVLGWLRKDTMIEGLTAPIHPGALKYYREVGLRLPTSTP